MFLYAWSFFKQLSATPTTSSSLRWRRSSRRTPLKLKGSFVRRSPALPTGRMGTSFAILSNVSNVTWLCSWRTSSKKKIGMKKMKKKSKLLYIPKMSVFSSPENSSVDRFEIWISWSVSCYSLSCGNQLLHCFFRTPWAANGFRRNTSQKSREKIFAKKLLVRCSLFVLSVGYTLNTSAST